MNTSTALTTKTTVFCWDNFPVTGNVLPSYLKRKDKPLESKINAFVIGLIKTIATLTLVIPTIIFTVELICALFKKKSNVDEKKAKTNTTSSVSIIEKKGSIRETVKKQGDSSSSGCMVLPSIDDTKRNSQNNDQIDAQKRIIDAQERTINLSKELIRMNFFAFCSIVSLYKKAHIRYYYTVLIESGWSFVSLIACVAFISISSIEILNKSISKIDQSKKEMKV